MFCKNNNMGRDLGYNSFLDIFHFNYGKYHCGNCFRGRTLPRCTSTSNIPSVVRPLTEWDWLQSQREGVQGLYGTPYSADLGPCMPYSNHFLSCTRYSNHLLSCTRYSNHLLSCTRYSNNLFSYTRAKNMVFRTRA